MGFQRIAVSVACLCLLACSTQASSKSPDAKDSSAAAKPVKLDILWVIDGTPSVCRDQRYLTEGFPGFIADLQKAGIVDVQMAVTTVQQIADIDKTGPDAIVNVGQFMHEAAKMFPPNCIEFQLMPCGGDTPCRQACAGDAACMQACADAQCTQKFDFSFNVNPLSSMCPASGTATFGDPPLAGTDWHCSAALPQYIQNDNCSINSLCRKHCTTNQECRDLFEPDVPKDQQRMICYVPGGTTVEKAGCMVPPATNDCPPPDQLPAVLDQAHLDLFHCNAMVGSSYTQEAQFWGGFRAAWMALDPNGPNCPHAADGKPTDACQFKQLVRDDALLLLVFMSDEDDCSVDLNISLDISTADKKHALYGDGVNKGLLPKDDMFRCELLGDAVGGNQALNDGYCEYRKWKDPSVLCASDCRGKTGADWDACMVPVTAMAKDKGFTHIDKRFAPVSTFVQLFRTLKPDPSHVLVAAITGDALPMAPTATTDDGKQAQVAEQMRWDEAAYYRSVIHNVAQMQAPSICTGKASGPVGFGSRYIQLAQALGKRGTVANLCAGSSMAPAFQAIAGLIRQAMP